MVMAMMWDSGDADVGAVVCWFKRTVFVCWRFVESCLFALISSFIWMPTHTLHSPPPTLHVLSRSFTFLASLLFLLLFCPHFPNRDPPPPLPQSVKTSIRTGQTIQSITFSHTRTQAYESEEELDLLVCTHIVHLFRLFLIPELGRRLDFSSFFLRSNPIPCIFFKKNCSHHRLHTWQQVQTNLCFHPTLLPLLSSSSFTLNHFRAFLWFFFFFRIRYALISKTDFGFSSTSCSSWGRLALIRPVIYSRMSAWSFFKFLFSNFFRSFFRLFAVALSLRVWLIKRFDDEFDTI